MKNHSANNRFQNLVIFGATGGVGSRLIERVIANDCSTTVHAHPSRIICVASSTRYYINTNGIESHDIKALLHTRGLKYQSATEIVHAIGAVTDNKHLTEAHTIYVDAAVGFGLKETYQCIIRNTESRIVPANKDVLALCSMEEFNELVGDRRIKYQTTVSAGADAIRACYKKRSVSRPVTHIEGALSGTMGYICSKFDDPDFINGKIKASQVVLEAKNGGFTEPNPWDDLNGKDVARKIVILSRSAGYPVEFTDVEILPLLPEKYGDYEGDEFMEKIKEHDAALQQQAAQAADQDKVLRYAGEMWIEDEKPKLRVGLKAVNKDSELGTLKGTLNVITLTNETQTQTYKKPGAGNDVTAESLQEDIEGFIPEGQDVWAS